MKVYYCGREDCEKGHFFGPAVRSHQLIHFVLKGKGIYRTGYGQYEIKAVSYTHLTLPTNSRV